MPVKGGYVLRYAANGKPTCPHGQRHEVQLIVQAAERLELRNACRIVSMPCPDRFEQQDAAYRASVLPDDCRARVAVEAASSFGWERYVGLDGVCVCLDHFGASAPAERLFAEFGFTVERVAEAAKESIRRAGGSR